MKKTFLILSLFASSILFAQENKSSANINIEGIYGSSVIFSEGDAGAVGIGLGTWLPFKTGFVDLSFDLTFSESRNNGEIDVLYDYPFSLIADSSVTLRGYVGGGLAIGRIFNKEKYFGDGVSDYNTGGFLGNVGIDLIPSGSSVIYYLDVKAGIVSVPKWAVPTRVPFKLSLGIRFNLE